MEFGNQRKVRGSSEQSAEARLALRRNDALSLTNRLLDVPVLVGLVLPVYGG